MWRSCIFLLCRCIFALITYFNCNWILCRSNVLTTQALVKPAWRLHKQVDGQNQIMSCTNMLLIIRLIPSCSDFNFQHSLQSRDKATVIAISFKVRRLTRARRQSSWHYYVALSRGERGILDLSVLADYTIPSMTPDKGILSLFQDQ